MDYIYIGAGLAIGLAGLGVALGQGLLTRTSIEILGRNPKLASTLRIFTILGIALVESAVIYGFIVAYQIIGSETITSANALSAGLAIGITALATGYGEGKIVAGSMESISRNPENKTTILQFMILFLALVEVVAIYGLIIAQKLINT